MDAPTITQIIASARQNLNGLYPPGEINQFISLMFEHWLNYTTIDVQLRKEEAVPVVFKKKVEAAIDQLKTYKPIQHIIGLAHFFGRAVKVNEHVLIPRQETEELVQWVIDDYRFRPVKILDLGTGSGCIAIALAAHIKGAGITGADISAAALKLAAVNAKAAGCQIQLIELDLLHPNTPFKQGQFDIMVSNPPYVRRSELALMGRNVAGFEPDIALYVEDDDPLIFYKALARHGKSWLVGGGAIYCEINEAFGREVVELFEIYGYADIELRKDINGKDRMVKAINF